MWLPSSNLAALNALNNPPFKYLHTHQFEHRHTVTHPLLGKTSISWSSVILSHTLSRMKPLQPEHRHTVTAPHLHTPSLR